MFCNVKNVRKRLIVFEGGCIPLNQIGYTVRSLITSFCQGFRRGLINHSLFLLRSKPSETSVEKLGQNITLIAFSAALQDLA